MKITLTPDTLRIGDNVIIDARRKVSERHPKGWIDPRAFQEIGDIWQELKKAYSSNGDLEERLREIGVERFGVKPENVEVIEIEGGIPEHWKEVKEEKIRLR